MEIQWNFYTWVFSKQTTDKCVKEETGNFYWKQLQSSVGSQSISAHQVNEVQETYLHISWHDWDDRLFPLPLNGKLNRNSPTPTSCCWTLLILAGWATVIVSKQDVITSIFCPCCLHSGNSQVSSLLWQHAIKTRPPCKFYSEISFFKMQF